MQEEVDKEEEQELTPDEIGRKIASQWTTDPDAAGSGLESDSAEADEEIQEEEDSNGEVRKVTVISDTQV